MTQKKTNILGSEYTIKFVESPEEKDADYRHLYGAYGCVLSDSKIILIQAFDDESSRGYSEAEGGDDGNLKPAIKRYLRHEILHAYLNECGLRGCALEYHDSWSRNEEMVDWFANVSPKIYKTYKELDILEES